MDEVMTQAMSPYAQAVMYFAIAVGGLWLFGGILGTTHEGAWRDRDYVFLGWAFAPPGFFALVVVAMTVWVPQTDAVRLSDAQAYVSSETGQDLKSKKTDWFGDGSALPVDFDGDCMADDSCEQWYVESRGTKWFFKAHDGELVFVEPTTKEVFTSEQMKVVDLPTLRKQVEDHSTLTSPVVKVNGDGPVLAGEIESAGSQLVTVAGEYKGRLVEAYLSRSTDGDIRLVPMGSSGQVSADDLMKK